MISIRLLLISLRRRRSAANFWKYSRRPTGSVSKAPVSGENKFVYFSVERVSGEGELLEQGIKDVVACDGSSPNEFD